MPWKDRRFEAGCAIGAPGVFCAVHSGGGVGRFQNVFACLVHEKPDCVIDLVHNLRCLDPASIVLLYNGGADPALLRSPAVARAGAVIHPRPQQMAWGRLHEFALDCLRFATRDLGADAITIVDSDQLAIRAGYSDSLAQLLDGRDRVGLLSNAPQRQTADTPIEAAQVWYEEFEFWRPLLRSFPDGESKFLYWSFWPSTVFLAPAARELLRFWHGNALVRSMVERSRVWASEEVLLPTLIALLGFDIEQNRTADSYVQYNRQYTDADVERALHTASAFWMHPVPRSYNHPVRAWIRHRHGGYKLRTADQEPAGRNRSLPRLLRPSKILDAMRATEGWLDEDEAELLLAAALHISSSESGPLTAVEIGSHCGRSTIVLASVLRAVSPASRVWAIDAHDGLVGAADQGLHQCGPTLDRFLANVSAAGVADIVETVAQRPDEVEWHRPIELLVIDGLHDCESVSRDFRRFEPWLAAEALIVFHDYASYFPGVVAFVDRLLAAGGYRRVDLAGSLIVVQKSTDGRPAPRLLRPLRILDAMRSIPGWLDESEGELLLAAAVHALDPRGSPHNVVEIGSYCGRSTIVVASVADTLAPASRVWAIDPHEGQVGASGQHLEYGEPTLNRFRTNVAAAGVAGVVETIVKRSYEVRWHRPIHLMLIDGLHDFANVSRDFHHFEPWIADGALVAFHDYATYYPGVMAFVDELLAHHDYRYVDRSNSLIVVQKWTGGLDAVDARATDAEAPPPAVRPRELPLVSCIMPTSGRSALVPQAIEYFRRQDYPNLELIVIDDGRDRVEALLPADPRIRYVHGGEMLTLAAKHNLACELAGGEIICHWDDDDWMAPWRVSYQVQCLVSAPDDESVCGLSTLLFYDPATRRAWRYRYPDGGVPWLSGATLCYRKRVWSKHPFPELPAGSDVTFVQQLRRAAIRPHGDERFYVATVHPANTYPRRVSAPPFDPWPSEEVEALIGGDLDFYRRWPLPAPVAPAQAPVTTPRDAPAFRPARPGQGPVTAL
jgi:predicted O-methyltransferase YrrM